MRKFYLILSLSFLLLSVSTIAQDSNTDKIDLTAGFDLATTYLWRGFEFSDGPVIQPWAQLSYKGLAVGTWASTSLTGLSKEIDLFASYSINSFTLSFTDLFTPYMAGLDQNYFDFTNDLSSHVSEIGLSYNGSENIPISISAGMLLYGKFWDPKTNDATALNHSTYLEVDYFGNIGDYSYTIFAGLTPGKSVFYDTDGFAFLHVGTTLGKELKVNESFSIPLSLTVSANPEAQKFFVALMCSF